MFPPQGGRYSILFSTSWTRDGSSSTHLHYCPGSGGLLRNYSAARSNESNNNPTGISAEQISNFLSQRLVSTSSRRKSKAPLPLIIYARGHRQRFWRAWSNRLSASRMNLVCLEIRKINIHVRMYSQTIANRSLQRII